MCAACVPSVRNARTQHDEQVGRTALVVGDGGYDGGIVGCDVSALGVGDLRELERGRGVEREEVDPPGEDVFCVVERGLHRAQPAGDDGSVRVLLGHRVGGQSNRTHLCVCVCVCVCVFEMVSA